MSDKEKSICNEGDVRVRVSSSFMEGKFVQKKVVHLSMERGSRLRSSLVSGLPHTAVVAEPSTGSSLMRE